jgi:hypothetical protein
MCGRLLMLDVRHEGVGAVRVRPTYLAQDNGETPDFVYTNDLLDEILQPTQNPE